MNIISKRESEIAAVKSIVEHCKGKIPNKYNPDQKYLVAFQDGGFIGLTKSLKDAHKFAQEYVWSTQEIVSYKGCDRLKEDHYYSYVILLDPDSDWSKKFEIFNEEETPFDEYFSASAAHFYDKEYLKEIEEQRAERINEFLTAESQLRKQKNFDFWPLLLIVVLVIIWIIFA